MSAGEFALNLLGGCIPLIPLILYRPSTTFAIIFPIIAAALLILYMKHKIGGYTGDCCGATALICKVMMILGVVITLDIL